jgi:hydroxyacylglutathione hydrolase
MPAGRLATNFDRGTPGHVAGCGAGLWMKENRMAVSFPAEWIHGAEDCRQAGEPLLHTHEAAPGTFIFRQSKCSSFEAPFMYLLVGSTQSLLLDTGAPVANGVLPIRETVDRLLEQHTGGSRRRLTVAHSHGHADHGAWDGLFRERPDTIVVERRVADIQARFGIAEWPRTAGALDLGPQLDRAADSGSRGSAPCLP